MQNRPIRFRLIGRITGPVRAGIAICLRVVSGTGRPPARQSSVEDQAPDRTVRRARGARDSARAPNRAWEAAQPTGKGATRDTPAAPIDADPVADAARRIGVDRMSEGALIAFLAEHRKTDPWGAEAAMRALELRGAPGRRD